MTLPDAASVTGHEHWTTKGDVRLFLWEKCVGQPTGDVGTILFVHGSSMASQPTFDLQVPGRPFSSVMVTSHSCWRRPRCSGVAAAKTVPSRSARRKSVLLLTPTTDPPPWAPSQV